MEAEEPLKTNGRDRKKLRIHPQQQANIFSKLFFCWALPLFVKGFKKEFTEEDLYGPLKAHESKRLGDKLERAWVKEANVHRHPSLWKILVKVYGAEFALYGAVVLVQELIVKMSYPILIGRLMAYYDPQQTTITRNDAYLYACGIIGVSLINIMIMHSYFLASQHLGMRIRVACCSLIYRKALKLSKAAMTEITVGQIINLMSNDVNRFDLLVLFIHCLIVAPLEAIVVTTLLYKIVDATTLPGAALFLVFVPLQIYLGKRTSFYRKETAVKTDQRVSIMNEIIAGIQVIKMYTWEKPFARVLKQARKVEIDQIRASSYLKAINVSFDVFFIRAAIFLCVLVYVVTGNTLTAEYVFVVTSYYSILRESLTMFLPRAIAVLTEANVSVKRLQKFLWYEEIKSKDSAETENTKEIGVSMNDVSVKWVASSLGNTLDNINFNVSSGQLIGVVGPIGSGKSTLLHTILKEINLTKGTLDVGGSISYAAQEPWLFPASIKQNILFGNEMDAERYQKVTKTCALESDLSLFPYGDRTIVGERGVMLSGGQKARINLARAIYKEADIYLLDDPLSAVDTHVGKQLFEDCISEYLKDKCTILVTHKLEYLRDVDRIYLLEHGTITASGTYNELLNKGGKFVEFLKENNNTEKRKEEREEQKTEKMQTLKPLESSEKGNKPVEVEEHRSTGTLSKRIYLKYLKAGGNHFISTFMLLYFILTQVSVSALDLLVTFWVNLEQERLEHALNKTEYAESWSSRYFTPTICIYLHSFLVIFLICITSIRSLTFFRICMRASKTLHNNMFVNIVKAPMRFFNTNPSGRILNRFSKDMGCADETVPQLFTDTLQVGLDIFGIITILTLINPWMIIPTFAIFVLFYLCTVLFLAIGSNLKRMEGATRSPVFTHLSASLQGLSTIRAFGVQKALRSEFDTHQDLHSSVYYMFFGCGRTFAFWLDMTCTVYVALVIIGFVFMNIETYGGNVGLAITQSLTMTGMLQWGMRQWSELEIQMTSVERIIEYTEIPSEPEEDKPKQLPKPWPEKGQIIFQSVCMRYSREEPLVLKNLSFTVRPHEKVGIVGRTGAGKSSLITAMFRLAPMEGTILIDDVDINEISLMDLRSKISIIPQDPVLFSGTLRKNLDPFDEYSDEQLWNALDEVKLKSMVAELPTELSTNVSEGGSNFSLGQRQLLCLARAVLRDNKILILDEATANVDSQTDELIQNTIRNKFKNCTVLTIAHRLQTIMDSDRVLVMSAGNAVEFDHPHLLLENTNGVFYGLVKQTGKGMVENLIAIAKVNYQQRQQEFT